MHAWAHVYSAFRGQWLPGDPRNFNSRKCRIRVEHRVHLDDPLNWDHAALYSHARSLSQGKVAVSREVAPLLLEAVRRKLEAMEVKAAALACHATHFHALIKVGDSDAKRVFGRAKQAGSHAIRHLMPGRIWGESSGVTRPRGFSHFASAFWYILAHVEQGAIVWCDEVIRRECELRHPDYRNSSDYQLGLSEED